MDTLNNHEISLQTAIDMTKRYRANRPANFPICETFEKEVIQRILDTAGCASFRVYFGMKENQQVSVILVAADAGGKDLLPASTTTTTATGTDDPVIIDDGYRCPDICPPDSPINS
ncbi:MAG: hypothetical protein ACTHJN_12155 [Ginsengibacter sp.]